MPTSLSDPSFALYVVLGVVTALFGIVALRKQTRSSAINFAIPAALLVALFLIDKFVESPRENVVRKIHEMGSASRAKNHDDVFKHVSESFKYKSMDKAGLRERAKAAEAQGYGGVTEWDLTRSEFKQVDENTVEQRFRAKVGDSAAFQAAVVATFKKEADGEWRLSTFKLFNPIQASEEMEIPGL